MVVEGEGGQKKRVGKIIEERTRIINKRGGEKTTRTERGKEQERGKENNRKRKGRKRKKEKEKERKGMIQRREAQLPAGASGASAQSPPTAPLRAGGLRAIRRAGKAPRVFEKSFFCVSGLKGLYERLVSQISIPQC